MKCFRTNREDLQNFELNKIEFFEVDHDNLHVCKLVLYEQTMYTISFY
jgi:hypothetical protein